MALIDDILEVLKDPTYKFTIHDLWGIRGRTKEGLAQGFALCPITALYHKKTGKFIFCSEFRTVATKMGYSKEEAEMVAEAADFRSNEIKHPLVTTSKKIIKIRQRMLSEMGVEYEDNL